LFIRIKRDFNKKLGQSGFSNLDKPVFSLFVDEKNSAKKSHKNKSSHKNKKARKDKSLRANFT
jgi:hypothetical protein